MFIIFIVKMWPGGTPHVEATLCLEAAERPQCPRVYSLDRPRSRGRMPSLVGDSDSGQVLGVQDGL